MNYKNTRLNETWLKEFIHDNEIFVNKTTFSCN